MKKIILIVLFICLLVGTAMGASVTLSWTAPVTNTDGSALIDLAGYNVYSSTTGSAGPFLKTASTTTTTTTYTTTFSVPNNTYITYWYTVTAFDTSGNQSDYSNIVSKSFFGLDTISPKVPTNLTIQ